MTPPAPNFIGIGAPKAGTTWLASCLAEHPEVFIAPTKETNFFDYDSIEGRWDEYLAHFGRSGDERAVGEISTRYLTSKAAPTRIRSQLPEVRLIVSLRDPVDQVYSHYWHMRRQNFHAWRSSHFGEVSFEEALERHADQLIRPALYATHLERWLREFSRSRLHVILYDDIRSRPHDVIRNLFRFLQVDEAFLPVSLDARGSSMRAGVSPRSPALGRWHGTVYDLLNRAVYHPAKRRIGVRRAIWIKDKVKVRTAMEWVFLRPGYPQMRLETRAKLRRRFTGEIERLGELLGVDLSVWKDGE